MKGLGYTDTITIKFAQNFTADLKYETQKSV
jgi:hypothetical protein